MNVNELKYSINQINTVTGDLDGNTEKIKKCIENDLMNGVDISIFPETAISGYMCGSLWDRPDFVKNQVKKLNEIVDHSFKLSYKDFGNKTMTIIIGYVEYEGLKPNGFPRLTNRVAVFNSYKGKVDTYTKQILANADQHEDRKYFTEGNETKIFTIQTKYGKFKIGTPLCEDAWFSDHTRNIPQEMVSMGAEILIVPNQSYFYYGKQDKRFEQFSKIAKNNNIPVVMVNSNCLGDILKNIVIFDGGSMVFDNNGRLLERLPSFQECTRHFNIKNLIPKPYTPTPKYKEITDALVYEQKEKFRLLGIDKAQVHMSGGLDSSIVGTIVTEAMGAENTIFISNPSSLNTKSKDYVNQIETALGVKVWWHPIEEIYQSILAIDKKYMEDHGAGVLSDTAKASIQAVLRTVLGISDSHRFKSGIIACGNHTENILGWFSYQDIGSTGVHAIIGDLTKVELYELCSYINDERYGKEMIPYDLYSGKFVPAAELPDAMEDPIDYWVQSGICASLIRDRISKDDLMWDYKNKTLNGDYFPNMDEVYKYDEVAFGEQVDFAIRKMKISVFKCAQSAPTVILSPRSRGFSNRETLINKYSG